MATTLKTAITKALKSEFPGKAFAVTKNRQGILIVEWDGDSPSKETVKAVCDSLEAEHGSWCGVRLWQTVIENPNTKIDAEIASLKQRLNKALVALTNEDRVGSPAWENNFHNINSLKDDIEMLHAQRV